MLAEFLGSQSSEKVLLYLLVNEECCAYHLQRSLRMSLTPLQKALSKLKKSGLLLQENRGKAHFYRFNPDYLLAQEVRSLLKKAYHHLPPSEKQQYYSANIGVQKSLRKADALLKKLQKQMEQVTQVHLLVHAKSDLRGEPKRKGKGIVTVIKRENSLTFQESGYWLADQCKFTNQYRWSWDHENYILKLEHLRFGEKYPVFLFDLTYKEPNILQSSQPYGCGNDTYFGCLEYNELFIHLKTRTIGLKKDECIESVYT